MTTTTHTTVFLTPAEGFKLTQKGDCPIGERIIAGRLALGVNDSVDNWTEITIGQAEAYKRQKEELQQQSQQ